MSKLPKRISRGPRTVIASASTRAVVCAVALTLPVIAPGTAVAACDATCQAAFLTAHNNVRIRLNAGQMPAPGPAGTKQPIPGPPLNMLSTDSTLTADSQTYANACVYQHSQTPGRGENLYASAAIPIPLNSPPPSTAVASWESESSLYTYGAIPAPNQSAVGHYTQLVWANTTKVGCGVTRCLTGSPFPPLYVVWDYYVCQYTPPGNFLTQFPYTVGVVPPAGGPLDVDGNGLYDAMTDGVIILRYLFGVTGSPLVSNLGAGARVTDVAAMLTKLDGLRPQFDIDLNGQVDALTDGVMIVRYLLGVREPALTVGAIGNSPTRTPADIQSYLGTLKP